ncbi:MAG: class I adenylate-forming enzyme family protein [Hypericibacter sp.]
MIQGAANLGERLIEACGRSGIAPALVGADETIDYRSFANSAGETAESLRKARIEADEPVLLAVSNRVRDLAGLCGIWLAGGVAVPVHRTSLEATVAALARRTGARLLVNMHPDRAVPASLAADTPVTSRGVPPPPRPLLAGAAYILFTSGSTGEPKGVVLAHDRFSRKLDMIDAALAFVAGERTLLPLQLTFIFGHWVSLLILLRGGTLELCEKFEAPVALEHLAGTRVRRVALVPTMLRALLPVAEARAGARYSGAIMVGGEPLPAALGRRYRALWPAAALGDIYGLTETGSCDFFLPPEEYDEAAGSIGRPGPGIEFRLSPGDGELQIRTPTAMRGYLDAPEPTAAAFDEGWFRTGDLARSRADGRVELVGRAKDLIFRGGNKISPLELERVFAEHPEVAGALAVGAPDALKGEALHLLIVPREGARLDQARLIDWARERLERFKLPDHIHFAAELPLGRSGKADRATLRQLIQAKTPPGR